jgi:Type IV secretion system pilin
MFKKLCNGIFLWLFSFIVTASSSTVFWVVTKDPSVLWGDNSYINPLEWKRTWGLWVAGSGTWQWEWFLDVVRNGINWLLGILALITLILLLWGGFQMVTAAGDDKKYGDGFTILKQAAFGLIMIGVAWFIVSLIFFVITLVTN